MRGQAHDRIVKQRMFCRAGLEAGHELFSGDSASRSHISMLQRNLCMTLRRASLLAAAVLLTVGIGVTPLYAVDAAKTDAGKTTAKTHKKKVVKETKPKPQPDIPANNSTGFNPSGY
jgi:hypothetical protein